MIDLELALSTLGVRADQSLSAETSDRGVRFWAIPGAGAIDVWRSLRSVVDQTGSWPLILGPRSTLEVHRAFMADENVRPPAELIAAAASINVEEFFQQRLQELEYGGPPRGQWPPQPTPSHQISIHLDGLSGVPHSEVILALAPVAVGWQALAFVPYGGWNECPYPEQQLAVQRHWQERHGSELLAIGHDTIECHVTMPPTTQDAAIQLALQQYAYCTDIVEQGTRTIEGLASTLLNGSSWFFWWD